MTCAPSSFAATSKAQRVRVDVFSKSKQIFITTHNPYILKEANLNEVILISRGKDGISNISKPIDDKKVQVFLKNDLGIDELFVDGILR